MKKEYLSKELESKSLEDFIQSLDSQVSFSGDSHPVPFNKVLNTILLNIEAHDMHTVEILMNEKSFNQITSIPSLKQSIEREMNVDKLKQGIKGVYHRAVIRISEKIPDNNILGLSEIEKRSYTLVEGTDK